MSYSIPCQVTLCHFDKCPGAVDFAGDLPHTTFVQTKRTIMWSEIQDMPGEIFDFDAWIEEASSDPEFIAQCEKNNAEFDIEVSQLF